MPSIYLEEVPTDDELWDALRDGLLRVMEPLWLSWFISGALAAREAIRVATKARGNDAYTVQLPRQGAKAGAVDVEAINNAGRNFIAGFENAWWSKLLASQRDQLRAGIAIGRVRGWTPKQVAEWIEPAFGPGRAELIAITELTRLIGGGAQAQYRMEGYETWEWRTAEDRRVDDVCQARANEEFSIETAFEPAHPRCRCWPVPGRLAASEESDEEPPEEEQPIPDEQSSDEVVRPGDPFPEGGFKTARSAKKWAEERWPNIEFDFTGGKMVNINPTLRKMAELDRAFPAVADRLQYVGTKPQSHGTGPFDDAYAYATVDGKVIGLNPKYYGDTEMSWRVRRDAYTHEVTKWTRDADGNLVEVWGAEKVPWHPEGTGPVESIFTHEFGHQVDHWLQLSQPAGMNTWREVALSVERRATLSQYAQTNNVEGFAEAFSQMHMADPSVWHPATKDLADFLGNLK